MAQYHLLNSFVRVDSVLNMQEFVYKSLNVDLLIEYP